MAMTRAEKYLYVTHAVKRRVFGEELASEPSQFLNEMPLELIEDLSRGKSWLAFARGSKAMDRAVGSLAYEYEERSDSIYEVPSESTDSGRLSAKRPGKKYSGKTYDSVESIEEFFRQRAARMGGQRSSASAKQTSRSALNADRDVRAPRVSDFLPGSYVRHAKYGRGLVLRREGSGEQTKLTVSFQGYGQKKLVEKYASLEKD